MLQQIENQTIQLSPAATQAFRDILTEKKLEGSALRVYLAGGGCSCHGLQFGMAIEKDVRDSDLTFEADGIKVVVDEVSIDYLRGAKIDFINDPQYGAGFVIDSPHTQAHEHQGESCACGGDCDCNN
jgi:iron-sulfur cluster assembly accessory protein